MHAVVVKVTISDPERAEEMLRGEVVPQVSSAPGFVAGYWTRSGNSGLSMIVFESEETARGAETRLRSVPPRDEVSIDDVDVREVVANA